MEPKGYYQRAGLPHCDIPGAPVHVTFRAGDSVPLEVIRGWQYELQHRPQAESARVLRRRVDKYLDKGVGSCPLRLESSARLVETALLHFNREKYDLHAWVVMPNHVHVLLTPAEGHPLYRTVQSWKSFTSRRFGGQGQLWQPDFFDRQIRSEHHMARTMMYIEFQPSEDRTLCECGAV